MRASPPFLSGARLLGKREPWDIALLRDAMRAPPACYDAGSDSAHSSWSSESLVIASRLIVEKGGTKLKVKDIRLQFNGQIVCKIIDSWVQSVNHKHELDNDQMVFAVVNTLLN